MKIRLRIEINIEELYLLANALKESSCLAVKTPDKYKDQKEFVKCSYEMEKKIFNGITAIDAFGDLLDKNIVAKQLNEMLGI